MIVDLTKEPVEEMVIRGGLRIRKQDADLKIKGSRRVILRKIDNTYASLSGKTFTIYKGSATTPYQPKGENPLENLQSGSSGCFWIGDLPYGWYIVEEGASGPYFYIVVTESGNYGTDFVGGYGERTDAENDAAAKYNEMKQSQ